MTLRNLKKSNKAAFDSYLLLFFPPQDNFSYATGQLLRITAWLVLDIWGICLSVIWGIWERPWEVFALLEIHTGVLLQVLYIFKNSYTSKMSKDVWTSFGLELLPNSLKFAEILSRRELHNCFKILNTGGFHEF